MWIAVQCLVLAVRVRINPAVAEWSQEHTTATDAEDANGRTSILEAGATNSNTPPKISRALNMTASPWSAR
jgi:hypothetical protein